MSKLDTCHVKDTGSILTAQGRLAYPWLFKTQPAQNGGEPKYGCSLIFPKAADLKKLADAVEDEAVKKFGKDYKTKIGRLAKPFKKTEDYPKMGFDPEEYPVFIRASSGSRPQVVDGKLTEVTEPEQAYAGRWARITVRVFAYDKAGNRGVSLGLQNVQILRDDERVGGGRARAEDEIDAVEDIGGSGSTDNLYD